MYFCNVMKIQYASDLHLEFYENAKYLRDNPIKPVGDILVLAGDIELLNRDHFFNNSFWNYISDNFKEVIVVAGNHEFYNGYDLEISGKSKICSVRNNVGYYYNAVFEIENVRLIVSPLWSLISMEQAGYVKRGVVDFHRILLNGSKLSVEDFNREHERCLNFIKAEVDNSKSTCEVSASAKTSLIKTVVATHHVPSFQLSSPDFTGSLIDSAFTVDLDSFIEASNIDFWIYGHSHRNIDKVIGNTKCVSNQLGYVYFDEHLHFDNSKVIDASLG